MDLFELVKVSDESKTVGLVPALWKHVKADLTTYVTDSIPKRIFLQIHNKVNTVLS